MALLLATSACVSGSGDPPPPIPGSSGIEPDAGYACEVFGTGVGDCIRPYELPGYVNPQQGIGSDFLQTISLADFYNDGGDELYPADSPFGEGNPKPRALVINVSAVWCGPCQQEAAEVLPAEYAHFKPLGGELLLVLADSENPGEAAGLGHLDIWVSSYQASYPSVIDPKYQLGQLFDQSQFPANFIINTRTMIIDQMVAGVPSGGFWQRLEEILAED